MATAVYESMVATAMDPLQQLLVKAGYWAQSLAEAAGGPFTLGMYENMTPFAQDPLQVLAAKLAYWLQQASLGGGGGGGGTAGVTKGNYGGVQPPVDGSVPTFFAFDTSASFLWYNSGTIAAPTWNNV